MSPQFKIHVEIIFDAVDNHAGALRWDEILDRLDDALKTVGLPFAYSDGSYFAPVAQPDDPIVGRATS